jgi:DNA-binding NarL/FixJ family response regulator
VVGEAAGGEEAVEICLRLQPDLVLMDVNMPGMDGFEATREVKQELPHTVVLLLTAMEDPEYLAEALRAGASGYVLKDLTSQRILNAVRRALGGESPLNQELSMELFRRLLDDDEEPGQEQSAVLAPEGPAQEEAPTPVGLELLTGREVEVLGLMMRGKTNRQIAQDLSIALTTAKNHVQRIIAKLGVSDRTQAAVRAVELGLVPKNSPPGSQE